MSELVHDHLEKPVEWLVSEFTTADDLLTIPHAETYRRALERRLALALFELTMRQKDGEIELEIMTDDVESLDAWQGPPTSGYDDYCID